MCNRYACTSNRREILSGWNSRGFTTVRTTTGARCRSQTSSSRTWTNTSAVLSALSSRRSPTGSLAFTACSCLSMVMRSERVSCMKLAWLFAVHVRNYKHTEASNLSQDSWFHIIEWLRERTEHLDIFLFFRPSLNGVLFPMFCLLVEGECQILVF